VLVVLVVLVDAGVDQDELGQSEQQLAPPLDRVVSDMRTVSVARSALGSWWLSSVGGVDRLGGWGGHEDHGALGEVAAVGATYQSSWTSASTAPTRRITESSLGNTPTTLVRRLTSLLTRSSGLVDQISKGGSNGWAWSPMTLSPAGRRRVSAEVHDDCRSPIAA
jgi:hypothetical protein